MDHDPFDIRFVRLRLHLEAREPLKLPPYKGSTFRGAFGVSFKRTVCVVRHRECARCLIRSQCVYPYVFDTPVSEGSGIFRGFREAPHPYVIEPPEEDKTDYAPGERMQIGLVLLGKAVGYLPYFIYTLSRMGETGIGRGRGKCALLSAEALTPDGIWQPAYDGDNETLRNDIQTLEASDLPAQGTDARIGLRFLTPTQIKVDGALLDELDFPTLVRGLLRRVSSLAAFHCGGSPDLDYRGLVAEAGEVRTAAHNLRWYDWERYSNRKKQRMNMGGFIGNVTFEGDLTSFQPLLALGAHLHVGKGTSFGLGQYQIA